MSGIYKVPFSYTGNAAPSAIDLCEVTAHATKILVLLGFTIFQTSDFKDAEEEGLELIFSTGHTVSGSGGSAVTPVPTQTNGGAAGFVAEAGNTTIAGTGTITERGRWGWNVRMEKEKMFTEAEQIIIEPALRGIFKYNTTPGDSLAIRGELILQEVG